MSVYRDPVRRPLRTVRHLPTDDRGLLDIEGWKILALFIEGRITAEQAVLINGHRVRLERGEARRDAA